MYAWCLRKNSWEKSGRSGIVRAPPSACWRARVFARCSSLWVALLIPNLIRKVLSSIRERRVRALSMGGQACVSYGAAEFSRDTDLVVLADAHKSRATKET